MDNEQAMRAAIEWEAPIFPVQLYNLTFPDGEYEVTGHLDSRLYRDKDFSLVCEVLGPLEALKKNQKDEYIGKGNIIVGCPIYAKDAEGNAYTLQGCFIHLLQSSSAPGYPARREITVKSVKVNSKNSSAMDVQKYCWYLCGDNPAHFRGITFRKKSPPLFRLRLPIDGPADSHENLLGGSSSKDYFTVKHSGWECIVAKVLREQLPSWADGICFEYREEQVNTSSEQSRILGAFLSFILGTELLFIGYTIASGTGIVETFHTAPYESPLQEQIIQAMPPVHFNLKYEWGDIDWLTQQLFPKFIRLYEPLKMDKILSRYFLSRTQPLGTNIPVLTTALEILAVSYLKMEKLLEEKYLPDAQWKEMIADMLKELEGKLAGIAGAEKIIGKIRTANNRNGSEKMSLFFTGLGIELGKTEKKVGSVRNKMTHSARDYDLDDNAYDDIILTRVYQCLFHRTLLKLLGYNEYYVDYSLQGSPSKQIDYPAGDRQSKKIR